MFIEESRLLLFLVCEAPGLYTLCRDAAQQGLYDPGERMGSGIN